MVLKNNSLKEVLLIGWVLILFTQVLRIDYKIIYFPIFIALLSVNIYLILIKGTIFKANTFLKLHLWIFFILIFYICGISFFYGNLNDLLKALPRMLIMPLTFIIFYNYLFKKKQYYKIIKIYYFFATIAAISIIYQIYFGPLEFLVSSSTRQGLERFASTAGSLTVFGAAVGIFLILTILLNINIVMKIFLFSLFFIAGLICLSKAGLMNVVIAIIFFIIISNYKLKNKILFLIGFILLSISTYFVSFNLQEYIDASLQGINILSDEHSSLRGQTSFRLLGAFTRLASDSIYTTFFGFGVLGGQGAFGLPASVSGTTHNQFGDLFQIGGIFLFLNVVSIIFCVMIELYKIKNKDNLAKIFFYCNLLAIINMFFFNGYLYQPMTSIMLWLSLIYVIQNVQEQ